jgi:hypothetical protein
MRAEMNPCKRAEATDDRIALQTSQLPEPTTHTQTHSTMPLCSAIPIFVDVLKPPYIPDTS